METSGLKSLGIYIHIPFCVRKCLYCDFLSAPAGEKEQALYVEALCREIEWESEKYTDYTVNTIFIGGGTPSVLKGKYISRILNTVHEQYKVSQGCEISMEVNPGTVTWEKLVGFKNSGGNRISIGLQSAADGELRALGRIHTYEDFLETYELAIKAGFSNLNVDLMTGVPGQTIESLKGTLQKITDLKWMPPHISAYSLIIEEGTPFYEKTPKLPDEDLERELYKITGNFLRSKGYRQYEISNYALPGYECRHNQVYWRRGNYVGFGIGAASMVENVRFRNTSDREKYMKCFLNNESNLKEIYKRKYKNVTSHKEGDKKTNVFINGYGSDLIKEDVQVLSEKEQMEEFMFLGLRMTEGVCADEFLRTFERTVDEVYPGIVDGFCQKGLLVRRKKPAGEKVRAHAEAQATRGTDELEGDFTDGEEWIALTSYGLDVSNRVMAEFLLTE